MLTLRAEIDLLLAEIELQTISTACMVLVMRAFGFAWSMGTHYAGACMSMQYSTRSSRLVDRTRNMAVFPLLGTPAKKVDDQTN